MFEDPPIYLHIILSSQWESVLQLIVIPVANSFIIMYDIVHKIRPEWERPCPLIRSLQKSTSELLRCLSVASLPLSLSKNKKKKKMKKGSHNFEIKKSHKNNNNYTSWGIKKKGKRTFVPSSVTVLAASLEENQ